MRYISGLQVLHLGEHALLLLKGSQTGLLDMAPKLGRKIMAVSQKMDQKGGYPRKH